MRVNSGLEEVLTKHENVFKEEPGTLNVSPAKIYVGTKDNPRSYKPTHVPYAMKSKVEAEIDRLLKENIIEPVKFSEWAAPIVPVLKPNNFVRICGHYKLTVNRLSSSEQYLVAETEDLFANLAGGQKFTKLDMSHAYQQVTLDEESKMYCTVNTREVVSV